MGRVVADVRARTVGLLVLLAVLAPLVPAASPAQAAPVRSAAEAVAETTMFAAHNAARAEPALFGYPGEASVGPLEWAEDVAEVARAWSDTMAATGDFKHNPDYTDETCCWLRVGENVAWVQPVALWGSPEAAAARMFQNLMDSPGHRANILTGEFDQVGIGVTIDENDRMWSTTVFRQYRVEPGVIEGVVTEADGRPAHWATVAARQEGETVAQVPTHADGTYRFANLAPGEYDLTVTLGGHEDATATVTVGEGETATRDFALRAVGGEPPTSAYVPMTPTRVLDTRDDQGEVEGALGVRHAASQRVAGVAGVPTDAAAVALNVTAVDPTESSFLTVWPSGRDMPTAASVNFPAGRNVGNFVIAEVGDGGRVDVYNLKGEVDVVFDVMGYFPAGTDYEAMVPTRTLDTREDAPVGRRGSIAVPLAGPNTPVPDDAAAVAINMTSVAPSASSFLTVFPTGIARPEASSLNFLPGQDVGNLVIAEVGAGGTAEVFNYAGAVDVVFDVVGYFPAGSDLAQVDPARLLDTRNPSQGDHAVPVGERGTISQQVTGTAGVPADAAAVAINITAVDPTASSFLTFYPTGQDRPNAATVNFPAGLNTNNMVLAEVGDGGQIDVFNYAGDVDVVLDVVGYLPG